MGSKEELKMLDVNKSFGFWGQRATCQVGSISVNDSSWNWETTLWMSYAHMCSSLLSQNGYNLLKK